MTTTAITSFLALSLTAAVAATPLSTFPHSPPPSPANVFPRLAPLLNEGHIHGSVNDSYIVMLKAGAQVQNHLNFVQMAHEEAPLVAEVATGVQQVYGHNINGYHARLSPEVVERLRAQPEVEYIEQDQIVKTTEYAVHDVGTMDTQRSAPWGLARISHRNKLSFGTFTTYLFAPEGGAGVDVYVVDTGINIEHVDFEGRAAWGKTIPNNDVDEDGNGHGSHCAGTIAGSKYGVAKGANLIAVKVLGSNGSGSMSDVVGGVVFAAESAAAKAKAAQAELKATGKTSHKGSVANMSLGGGKSPSLDTAVNRAVDSGLHFAVAAGNDNKDACNYSPASAANAVTVGASTLSDDRAYFSNLGKCVDVFGPGLNIQSTYKGSPYATATLSGTSMASPHVAGLLAYLLSIYPHATFDPSLAPSTIDLLSISSQQKAFGIYELAHAALPRFISAFLPAPEFVAPVPGKDKTLDPAQLKKALLGLASVDKLADVGSGSPNLLIFNNATSA